MTDVITSTDDFADEFYDPRPDGTVILRVNTGVTYRLRRPNFGELRALRAQTRAMDDDLLERLKPLNERLAALRTPDEPAATDGDSDQAEPAADPLPVPVPPEVVISAEEIRALDDAITSAREEAKLAAMTWFAQNVLQPFASPTPQNIEPAKLPEWVGSVEFVRELIEHWHTLPRRPGVE